MKRQFRRNVEQLVQINGKVIDPNQGLRGVARESDSDLHNINNKSKTPLRPQIQKLRQWKIARADVAKKQL
jgi:hypothetical protein